MFYCECYPNHRCCKNYDICELWIPVNKQYSDLSKEISFELKHLNDLTLLKHEYFKVLSELEDLVYTITLCIKGKLIRVPKLNAKGEYMLKPDDVIVNLNYNVISQEIKDTENIIRELRKKERNILKILKKRADKYD